MTFCTGLIWKQRCEVWETTGDSSKASYLKALTPLVEWMSYQNRKSKYVCTYMITYVYMLCFNRNGTFQQWILFHQNYSYLILKLNANNLLLGLHPHAKFIAYKMSCRLHRGDAFQLCLPLPQPRPPHTYTQAHTNVSSISLADKTFFRVDSPIAESELSTVETVVQAVEMSSSWDDRSKNFFCV